MKKERKQNGFSLVELLIVLAILAIIAAISISIFANVLENQKQRADIGQASFIQSAIQTYFLESSDTDFSIINATDTTDLDVVINGLKQESTAPDGNKIGPYIKDFYLAKIQSKKYEGFLVTVNKNAESVTVVPSDNASVIEYE